MIRSTERTAAKVHLCGCGHVIRPGDRHIENVASPDHEGLTGHFWARIRECEACAVRYGRLRTVTEGDR